MSLARCLFCTMAADHTARICYDCWQSLPWVKGPLCTTCGAALPSVQAHCGECARIKPYFDGCLPGFQYTPVVAYALKQFKLHKQLVFGRLLADALAAHPGVKALAAEEFVWVPVPLHWRRQWYRGFNQSVLLLQYLEKHLPIQIKKKWVRRSRNTLNQRLLKGLERQRNVQSSFALRRDVSGERVVLFDDVMTTGATLNSLAKLWLYPIEGGI